MIGLEDRKVVHIVYQSLKATEPVTYEIHLYAVIYHRGSLYVVAYSEQHDEVRHFKVDRMEEAETSQFPFQRPDEFDVKQHLDATFGILRGDGDVQVEVKFLPAVGRYVLESSWHPSQQLDRQKDGSVVARFRLDDTREIKSWILGFGKHAFVLSPESLRQEIVGELQSPLDRYRRPEQLAEPGQP